MATKIVLDIKNAYKDYDPASSTKKAKEYLLDVGAQEGLLSDIITEVHESLLQDGYKPQAFIEELSRISLSES